MAVEITLEPGTMELAAKLAPLLRDEDVAEVWASGRRSPLEALERAVGMSELCVAILADGEPAALFGISESRGDALGPRFGCVWFLTGRAWNKYPLALVRSAKLITPALQVAAGCDVIGNWLDTRYTGALRLAECLGFKQGERTTMGGVEFVMMRRTS